MKFYKMHEYYNVEVIKQAITGSITSTTSEQKVIAGLKINQRRKISNQNLFCRKSNLKIQYVNVHSHNSHCFLYTTGYSILENIRDFMNHALFYQ